eukprot:scaffold281_cov318-Pavlova_lutheri.AAC.60
MSSRTIACPKVVMHSQHDLTPVFLSSLPVCSNQQPFRASQLHHGVGRRKRFDGCALHPFDGNVLLPDVGCSTAVHPLPHDPHGPSTVIDGPSVDRSWTVHGPSVGSVERIGFGATHRFGRIAIEDDGRFERERNRATGGSRGPEKPREEPAGDAGSHAGRGGRDVRRTGQLRKQDGRDRRHAFAHQRRSGKPHQRHTKASNHHTWWRGVPVQTRGLEGVPRSGQRWVGGRKRRELPRSRATVAGRRELLAEAPKSRVHRVCEKKHRKTPQGSLPELPGRVRQGAEEELCGHGRGGNRTHATITRKAFVHRK